MNVLEIKASLFDLIWSIEDADILEEIHAHVTLLLGEENGWDDLTPEQKASLELAIREAENGENLISHEQVMAEIEARLR